ncbi:MAG TPA: hypothetical protein VII96_01205 [Acidimicrobiales bacterium]
MSDMRKYLAFVLMGILTLVGGGFAALGAVQSKSGTNLSQAVANTLKSSNYTEDLVEKTPQGNQKAHLVFQSPDRLGGWLLSSGRKTYLFIIGTKEFIAVTRSATAAAPTKFFTQQTTGAVAVDPAHTYLPYYNKGPSTRNGAVTTVTLSQGGQTETLTYTVTGNYVSNFKAVTPGGTIELAISEVGTSPKVELPKGYTITTVVPSQG